MQSDLPREFNETAYLRLNSDVQNALGDGTISSAAQHYIDHGQKEGRDYSEEAYRRKVGLPLDFDEGTYLDLHIDVAKTAENGNPFSGSDHYLAHGEKEGRIYNLTSDKAKEFLASIGNSQFRYPYRSFDNLPKFEFGGPSLGKNDFEICERLISAWHLSADSDPGGLVGIWQLLTSSNAQLANALKRRDPENLSAILSNMFQEHIVHGLGMGRTISVMARHAPERFSAMWCDVLLRLSEAVGISPVRSPEQGGTDGPLVFMDVIPQIEKCLGFKLYFPPIGAAYGVSLNNVPFPGHAFNHAYVAWRINSLKKFDDVAEIGGGYGGLCYFMAKFSKNYTIYDLPHSNLIQSYFLIKSGLPVSLNGEEPSSIKVLPWWQINDPNTSFDLMINQDSIPEMPLEAGRAYIKRIKQISPYFYSVNQEACAPNIHAMSQLYVPDLIRDEGGYRLSARNIFWLRDGYIEEIYETAGR